MGTRRFIEIYPLPQFVLDNGGEAVIDAMDIHLEDVLLGGGGFKSMLEKAVKQHARGCEISGAYKDRFLIVDADRAQQGDWSLERLKAEAAKHKFTIGIQNPNHEGLLLRMIPGMEREISDAASS